MIAYTFHPEAEAELAEAALFYESRSAGLGRSLIAEVLAAVREIREYPELGSPIDDALRRMTVRRFPYSLVYRYDQQRAVIIAVVHQSRRPGYWHSRN